MKINPINNISYGKQSFKHTAVPYPEYEQAYLYASADKSIFKRISQLFNPKVDSETQRIKSAIDSTCKEIQNPKKQLLSVLV